VNLAHVFMDIFATNILEITCGESGVADSMVDYEVAAKDGKSGSTTK